MNTIKLLNVFAMVAIALLLGRPALATATNAEDVIVFTPLDVTDYAGRKLSNGLFTHQGQSYAVILDGMSIGGAIAKGVTVTGVVSGLTHLNDLQDTYITELSETDEVSSQSVWLQSKAGVRIQLQTDNPDVAVASGGDAVSLQFVPRP